MVKNKLLLVGLAVMILAVVLAGLTLGLRRPSSPPPIPTVQVKEQALPPTEIISIPLSPKIQGDFSRTSFLYHKISLYAFHGPVAQGLDPCLVMREWNVNRAYYSCGKEGQQVLALEAVYFNTSENVQSISPGTFRIQLEEGKYLEPNFTVQQIIEVDPGVKYTYRAVFENFEKAPRNFILQYGDLVSPGRLAVDLDSKTVVLLNDNTPSPPPQP